MEKARRTGHRPTASSIAQAAQCSGRWLSGWINTRPTWADGVAKISYQINCANSKAIKRSPHELIFGRKVRLDSVPMTSAACLHSCRLLYASGLPVSSLSALMICHSSRASASLPTAALVLCTLPSVLT